jgi:hypothetical protein
MWHGLSMEARAAGDQTSTPVRLRSLSGDALPDELFRDAQRAVRLNDGAFVAIAPLLRALVLDPMTPELGEHLSRLCVRHEVAEADLGHVVKVARWLLREASAADLGAADLEADARAIWPDSKLISTLVDGYGAIKAVLRQRLLDDALVKHGNVLVDVDWRLDLVSADRRAAKLVAPVAVVTLAYKSDAAAGRLTLQLLPEQIARLEQLFGALARRTRSQDA